MPHGICRAGLAVNLAFEWQRYDFDLLSMPRSHGDLGRVFFHELTHVWQILSESFLSRLAVEEYHALITFDSTGHLPHMSSEESLEGRFTTKHPTLGFSAQQLMEAMTRMHDIGAVGPDRVYESITGSPLPIDPLPMRDPYSGIPAFPGRAISMTMTVEDAYAEPYRYTLDRWGIFAPFIFPLIAHYCLQTDYPVDVFAAVIDQELRIAGTSDIPNPSVVLSEPVRSAVYDVAARLGAQVSSSKEILAECSPNPLFAHYVQMLGFAESQLGERALSLAFSDPVNHRSELGDLFQPSVTCFEGERNGWVNCAQVPRQLASAQGWDESEIKEYLTELASAGSISCSRKSRCDSPN